MVLALWSTGSLARQKKGPGKIGWAQLAQAETSKAAPDARQYVFTRFTTLNGLSSNIVNNLVQDRKGYIWLATPNGLQRYDGNKFITFKHQHRNPSTLPDDNVGRVYMDKKQRLWILTADNKIGIFDTERFSYQLVNIDWQTAQPTIYVAKLLTENNEGELLLMMGWHEVYKFSPDSNSFLIDQEIQYKPANWKRHSYYYDTVTRRSWIGCDSGLVMYDPATRHINYQGHNPDKNHIIDVFGNVPLVLQFHIDEKRFAMMATWNHFDAGPRLHSYDNRTGEKRKHAVTEELYGGGYNEINGILQQRNGRLWAFGLPFIAEYVGGPHALQGLRNDYKDEQSLGFDVASYMYEDRAQNLWLCTSNGLYLFNPDAQFFNAYSLIRPDGKGAVDGASKCILEVDSNQIWVGGWGVGLFAYDRNFKPVPLPPSLQMYKQPYAIWCMERQKTTRDIWMGVQDGPVIIYEHATGKANLHWFDIFEHRTIRQVIQDKQGNLWFGTQGGLIIKWTYKPGQTIKDGFKLITRTALVFKLFADKDGYIWAGTFGKGLLKIDPVKDTIVQHFGSKGSKDTRLWNDSPSDMVQLNDSTLLIANHGLSLLNVRTGKTRFISTDEGLPANNVMCLAKDRRNVIWLGMISGICRMNLETMTFTYYDRRDGMPADYFETDDAHHLSDGRILFTSAHHFVAFDPEKMIKNQPPPKAEITDIALSGISQPVDSLLNASSVIHLQHDKSSITIEFGSFNFIRQDKTDYYYQLSDVDKDWVHATDRRQAIYNYLRPGNYIFKVKSRNADGVESTSVTTLRISVKPPFWRSWWFYGFLILLAIGILYWIDRERMRRIRELQDMRTQIAGNLHSDINTTLNNINMLSEMAKIKADKDLTRSKEYIDQISEKSHNMIIAMDDMLWSIDPQNDSMEKTLLRMLEFVDALINRHGANIDILVDEQVRSLQLDMKSRHEMFLIFKEVLRGMVHESSQNHVLINIDLIKSKLSVKLQDDGAYAGEGDLFSIQTLDMLSKRTGTIHAELDIQADKNGASVILLVPVH